MAEKKQVVEFEPKGGFEKIKLDGIPGSPLLFARLDPSSTVFTSKVRAIVIGAESIGAEGSLDTEMLKKIGRGKDGAYSKDLIAEYLLNNGYIRVLLRSFEDISSTDAKGGDTGSDGGTPPPAP